MAQLAQLAEHSALDSSQRSRLGVAKQNWQSVAGLGNALLNLAGKAHATKRSIAQPISAQLNWQSEAGRNVARLNMAQLAQHIQTKPG